MLILSQDEADLLRDKLEGFRLAIYKTGFEGEKYIDENFTESEKSFILNRMKPSSSANKIEKSISELLKEIRDMETISVKLAFEPNVSFVEWLKEFLRREVKADGLIVKLKSDRSMLAGVVLEFNGKIIDRSAKAGLLDFLSGVVSTK